MFDIAPIFAKYGVTQNTPLIIACSGGPDSMFLVEQLLQNTKYQIPNTKGGENNLEFGIRNLESEKTGNLLVIAHVHHIGFRDESEEDKRFVEKYCDEHALFLETMTLDADEVSKKHKTSPENACRIERRDFFETLREKYGAKYILTGHHLDDQIETMMYRLIRGAKIHGLCGIQEREGNYLRPLLGVKKSDILSWLSDNKIPFCQDSSNEDDTYLRNHIRKNITPEFEKINPEYHRSFERLSNYFGEMKEWIDSQFFEILEDQSFSLTHYGALPNFLQRELIRAIYESTNDGTIGLSQANISEVQKFIEGKHGNKKKSIGRMHLYKKGGMVTWKRNSY